MKIVVVPRVTYIYTVLTKIHRETYFGNLVSSTADTELLSEWVDGTTYNYLDEVVVNNLKTKYTATVDNPQGHPSTSNGWFSEGINENRISDSVFTSQSVYTGACETTFNIRTMTHIIGQNIENAKDILMIFIRADGTEISTVFDCDACVVPETRIEMAYYESFDCDSCCNPEAVLRSSFSLKLNQTSCEDAVAVKVVMTKLDESKPILIGVLSVGKAYDLGCTLSGITLELSLPNLVTSFPAIGHTGVAPANIETKISGVTIVERKLVDELRTLISKHGAFLNFYIFDEVDEIKSGIILGRFTRLSTPITASTIVKVPIEIIGMQI